MSYYPHYFGSPPRSGCPATEEAPRLINRVTPEKALPPPTLEHSTPGTSSGTRLYPTLDTASYSTLPRKPTTHGNFEYLKRALPQVPYKPATLEYNNHTRQYVASETTASATTIRPSSIRELKELAFQLEWDPGADFKLCFRDAERYRQEGKESLKNGDYEVAFVRLAKAATLFIGKLPVHRDFYSFLNEDQRHNLVLNGQDILKHLAEIRPLLVERYDLWMKQHANHALVKETRTRTAPDVSELYGEPGDLGEVYDNLGHLKILQMTESPANSSASLLQPGISSLVARFSSIRTEDLTGSVRRESEYPAHGGGYADVYTGILTRKARIIKVAIKVIRSHTYTSSNQWKIDKRLRREILLWSCLRHPNVVPLLGTTTGFGAYPAMVCPWMRDGNLSHYLSIKKHDLSLRKRLQILADVVEGLVYLHSQSVIHGDLTTGNILMDEGKAHLSDFGLSNVMIEVRNNSFMSSTISGSPRWTAPELLHIGAGVPDVTKHCDVYSFGSVTLQTITGRIPYEGLTLDVQVLMEVMRGGTPVRPPEPLLSDEMWDLIISCWSRDPFSRPEIGQVRESLHILRYDYSEEELMANVVHPDKTSEQDEEQNAVDEPWLWQPTM